MRGGLTAGDRAAGTGSAFSALDSEAAWLGQSVRRAHHKAHLTAESARLDSSSHTLTAYFLWGVGGRRGGGDLINILKGRCCLFIGGLCFL